MTQLERHQRGVLALIKNRAITLNDSYLELVAGSPGLAMLREIAIWWRALQLEAQCRFTSRLLKRLGRFDEMVLAYFNSNPSSPFIEELSRDFLDWLRNNRDPLIRAVSQFELAFIQARAGASNGFQIVWDRHPDLVMLALDTGRELPDEDRDYVYHMEVGSGIPVPVSCTRKRVSE
jgi:hypothetical protein